MAVLVLDGVLADLQNADGIAREATIDGHSCFLQYTSHPYADFALDGRRRLDLADQLKHSWELAST
jgi:hypothetical protein